jgi:ferrous iron transport protein B
MTQFMNFSDPISSSPHPNSAHTKMKCVALVGQPNSGKTALFNSLSGLRRKVANYPGVTVERFEGLVQLSPGKSFSLLDLPGTYSLNALSEDERVTTDSLKGHLGEKPDVIVAVVNSMQLRGQLPLLLELSTLGIPLVVALNMNDRSLKFGLKIDLEKLSAELGALVVKTVASRSKGKKELLGAIESCLFNSKILSTSQARSAALLTETRIEADPLQRAKDFQNKAVKLYPSLVLERAQTDKLTARLDGFLLHPIAGPIILLLTLFLTFQAVFVGAKVPMEMIIDGFAGLGDFIKAHMAEGFVRQLLVEGFVAGVGSVVVFLPQILVLFAILLTLEDTGYMSRAAVILDRPLRKIGLSGKSVFPLLSGYACAIPGIMSSRTISSKYERILTMALVPLATCSARLPVYTLLIAAFVPEKTLYGFVSLQGLTMMGLYFSSGLAIIVVSLLAKIFVKRSDVPALLLELPAYMMPSFRNVAFGLWDRARGFLKKAGTYILMVMIILWAASTFPLPPEGATAPAITYSLSGMVGQFLSPLFAPIGFDWKIVVAIVSGFAAREVLVSALGVVYAVESQGENLSSLSKVLQNDWGVATAFALMGWYVFAPQCLATFAVLQREMKSWKVPAAIFMMYLVMAYIAAGTMFHLVKWIISV